MQGGAIRGCVRAVLAAIFLCWLAIGAGAQTIPSQPSPGGENAQNAQEPQSQPSAPKPPDWANPPTHEHQGKHQSGAEDKPQDQRREAGLLATTKSLLIGFVDFVERNDKF